MLDYQNPNLPIARRVADLLSRMTLEEKAAQTCLMRGVEYATKPSDLHNCSVKVDTDFDEDKLFLFQDAGEIISSVLYSSDDVVPHTVFEQSNLPIKKDGNWQKTILPKHSIAAVRINLTET